MSQTDWKPPAAGAPCWIQVCATDVPRARKFYEEVFGWKIREGGDPGQMVHFETPGSPGCPGGGITKVADGEFVKSNGKGGVALYLTVNDLKSHAETIIKAGGKQLSEVQPEGEHAIMQQFEDTEGNYFGIHEWQGKK